LRVQISGLFTPAMTTNETRQDWLTESEAAVYIGKVPKATLKQWRWLQQGPPYSKVGQSRLLAPRPRPLDRGAARRAPGGVVMARVTSILSDVCKAEGRHVDITVEHQARPIDLCDEHYDAIVKPFLETIDKHREPTERERQVAALRTPLGSWKQAAS
jgi:hypothetical protein